MFRAGQMYVIVASHGGKTFGTPPAIRCSDMTLLTAYTETEGNVMSDGLNLCSSSKMQPIRDLVAKVAGTNTTVLLRGESGVGKEVVAHALHKASPRASKQFLKVNCAALPGELLESELFGHEKGAFTGAYRQKPGKFEAADGGTLMLDEIGEMPLRLQAKMLHVLQDGEFCRVGGEKIIGTDVRLIASTNRDLESAMRMHQFREDLYYRLNVIEIRIPPLRERREEVPLLIDHFKRKFSVQYGRSVDIPAETVRVFVEYHWPGNIRELENAVKRVIVLGSARTVHQEIVANLNRGLRALPGTAPAFTPVPTPDAPVSLKDIARQAAREAERVAIKEVLDRVHWNRAKAARLLQISYKALLYKIVQCGLATQDTEKEKEVVAS
jgi:two-component system, NtrC family, response regulator AtoC